MVMDLEIEFAIVKSPDNVTISDTLVFPQLCYNIREALHQSTNRKKSSVPSLPSTTALTSSKIEDEHFAECNELPFHSTPGLDGGEGGGGGSPAPRGVGGRRSRAGISLEGVCTVGGDCLPQARYRKITRQRRKFVLSLKVHFSI